MDTLSDGPPDDGGTLPLNQLSGNAVWPTTSTENSNNPTTLYIAVEFIKPPNEFKAEPNDRSMTPSENNFNYEQHVSPLDPNMSSVASYSPIYSESSSTFNNPVVVHQLGTAGGQNQTGSFSMGNSHADGETATADGGVEIRQVVNNGYLQMIASEELSSSTPSPVNGLQFVPDAEQEVELFITDQATGISYSVSTQEFLVERCLEEDQQLLDALVRNPLLDSDLLTLDDSTLKSQLSDIGDPVEALPTIVNNSPDILITPVKEDDPEENFNFAKNENLRRSKRQNESLDDSLMPQAYTISDKPVLSRARATLPESYLVINKRSDGFGVFAKRMIPKRTWFGPLEGLLIQNPDVQNNDDNLKFLITNPDGSVNGLDISDEDNSNWMCFVKRATKFSEHNLVVTQQDKSLFYVTTKNILPKQELLVDYGAAYAEKHKLTPLKPEMDEENAWPCFECQMCFFSSEQLQKHLNMHDEDKHDSLKPRKKNLRPKRKVAIKKYQKPSVFECVICKQHFSHPKFTVLKKHLLEHGIQASATLQDKFITIRHYKCVHCEVWFNSEALLRIHNLQHDADSAEEQTTHVCPCCQHKFPTQRQLVTHVLTHATKETSSEICKGYKCTSCYKIFATRERIQRHMLVHGSEESKPIQCCTCKKRFLNNSALACHLKTHYIGKKIFECPICKDSFDHVLQLKSHVPKHCENGIYTCPHCLKIFKKYSIIRKHIRAFHCERIHSCPHCSKSFPTLDKLRMHLLRHSDHREFLCADCGKQFKRKDKLKEHCKRMHSEERENNAPKNAKPVVPAVKKFTPRVEPTDYHRFIYKCHACMVGFKRRGMLVNHLAKRHPDISPDSVPELNLPILRTTRDYYCQYCDKVYKSSSKRKAHILKNHPGAALPMSNRKQGSYPEVPGLPNPTFSQTVGSVTTHPQSCQWCHKQYASKAKLLQHQRKKHSEMIQKKAIVEEKVELETAAPLAKTEEDMLLDVNCFKSDFKVSDEDIMSEMIELRTDKDGSLYHLVSVASLENPTIIGSSDSRLYRLLTTGNSMVPPR